MNKRSRALLMLTLLVASVLMEVVLADHLKDSTESSSGHGHIAIYRVNTHNQNDTFVFEEVRVNLVTYYDAPDRYDHVMLCFYGERGHLMTQEDLGTLNTPVEKTNVTDIHLESRPKYIVADHPKLRSPAPDFDQEIIVWNNENNSFAPAYPDALPFDLPRTNKVGTCP